IRYDHKSEAKAAEHVGVASDLHNWPAQPFAMTSFISSIDRGSRPSSLREPKTSSIFQGVLRL
ncbi:hypothetical protein, partial [Sphingomonas sp. dw_22]|uniref:hypothetical protein n=1 Tax=Sphingomonas sp. dw_22 TaxID=2721175 RepID=UPI001BD65035